MHHFVHDGGRDENTAQFHFIPKVDVVRPLQAEVKLLLKTPSQKMKATIIHVHSGSQEVTRRKYIIQLEIITFISENNMPDISYGDLNLNADYRVDGWQAQ